MHRKGVGSPRRGNVNYSLRWLFGKILAHAVTSEQRLINFSLLSLRGRSSPHCSPDQLVLILGDPLSKRIFVNYHHSE